MAESPNPLGLPYGRRTPQMEGRRVERQIARENNLRLHPMSGAGRIKEDASDEERVVEIKNASKSFTLNAADLNATFNRAVRAGKDSVWIIRFANGIEATIDLSRWSKGGTDD